ncbi:MAG: hypothetical protein AAGI34_18255 [Pseudomonadota bacterium]
MLDIFTDPRDYLTLWRAITSVAVALVVSSMGINVGLRLIPAGRHFLKSAREQGKLLANLNADADPQVRSVFALSGAAALIAAVMTWFMLTGGFSAPVPYPVAVV